MERTNNPQLELFSKPSGYFSKKTENSGAFLRQIWKYEKAILFTIVFIIISLFSFSLGVEKGKKISALKANAHLDMANNLPEKDGSRAVDSSRLREEAAPPKAEKSMLAERKAIKDAGQGYTIQVATFRTKTYAQREAESLKKKGFLSLVLAKGNFNVVCVGNFYDQKQAEPLLSKLKKDYQGCYVRRL